MRKIFFKNGELRTGWGILLFVFIVVSLRLAQYFVLTRHLTLTHPPDFLLEEALRAGIVIFATCVMARVEGRSWLTYGLGGASRTKLLAVGSALGFATLSALVATLLFGGYATFAKEPTTLAWIILAGIAWLLAFYAVAFFEELLLRGYLQYALGRRIGFWWAALWWSAIFIWMHTGNDGETPLGLAQTGIMALFFCLSLRITGSLWWAIGFHASWDWAESFFYGTANSGMRFGYRLLTESSHGNPLWSGGSTGPEGSIFSLFVLVIPCIWLALQWRRSKPSIAKETA